MIKAGGPGEEVLLTIASSDTQVASATSTPATATGATTRTLKSTGGATEGPLPSPPQLPSPFITHPAFTLSF